MCIHVYIVGSIILVHILPQAAGMQIVAFAKVLLNLELLVNVCVCVCVCVCVYVCVCVCVCGTMVKNVATLKSLCQENNSQDSQDSDDPKRVLRLILDICTGTLFLAFSSCLEISSSQSISSQSIILDFKSILVHATIFY